MEEWVRAKVALLALDADVYVAYGQGLLEDEDMEVEERVQSVIGMFSGAAEGLVAEGVIAATLDEASMVADVRRILAATTAQHEQQEDLRRVEQEMRDLKLREKQKKEAEEALEREREKAAARQKMSREELAAREQLISEYGFSAMSEFDEDGNVVKISDKEKSAAKMDNISVNSNKQRVQQAQNAMREKMKKEHDKKVTHEKELLAKDRARKDKAKKRTVKREKQRGCG